MKPTFPLPVLLYAATALFPAPLATFAKEPTDIHLLGSTPLPLAQATAAISAKAQVQSKAKVKTKRIRHVVCFKFKEDATEAQIKQVEKAFAGLKKKIPEIKGLEWGLNNSPEGLNKGFTHCFIVTFANEKGREIYLPHPDHKAFVKILKPILDDVFVIDF